MDLTSGLRAFRRPWLWLGIWCFGWALCIVLSMMHPTDFRLDVPEGDKLEHFTAYAILSAWSVLIFAARRSHWKAAAALLALGIAIELAQGAFTSDRTMDARDALADALGIGFGQWLALFPAQLWLQRWDTRLFS